MTEPSAIVEGLEEGGYEVFASVSILLQRLDAILELQEHVQSNDHHLFQVRVRYLFVEEVPGDKCAQALLKRRIGQQAYLGLGRVNFCL